MANESYSEKMKRVRKEQKARFLKKQEENKKKSAEDDIVRVRAKKPKSSKLGSGAYSSGSSNPTSKFQDMKKKDTKKSTFFQDVIAGSKTKNKAKDNKSTPKGEKAIAAIKKMLKSKGKASANDNKTSGPVKSASSVKVKSGNTLSQIAKSKGITLKALLAANPSIKDANKISIGQSIKIPASDKGGVYKGMSKTEMAKMAMKNGGMTMKKKTKYMAKGGYGTPTKKMVMKAGGTAKKTKYMAKGGMKKTKYMAKGGAAKRK